jgi:allantoinase
LAQNPFFEFSGIARRPALRWPNGARLAVWVVPNVEYYPIDQPGPSLSGAPGPAIDCMNAGWREYGPRVGIWRVMESMVKYCVPGTAALNGLVATEYPAILEEAKSLGWAFMGHGMRNGATGRLTGLEPEQERALIRETVRTLEEHTGSRPQGWLGTGLYETPNTTTILAEEGFAYVADWGAADDQPFPLSAPGGRLLGMPYAAELNDMSAFLRSGLSNEEFYTRCREQFDVLYAEGAQSGRVLCLAIHPFVIGQPYRIRALNEVLEYVTGHPDVWLTTGDAIAAWYLEQYPSL